ncbi:carbohydrate ABC transporter membrane protein 2, CUT1 family [Rathayibacter oskolensis]|uniref:Carbohydrate ABC transporter membrane protein 2, CUT1 family n=1 Tax=Rathayibacter oskolensis TaxID=1891671 RepID=A0A1X7PCN6_9MICO|nr:carbohydrate ABC transporter permease [Rathayibacter oskolensis]SMH49035.1 carbohydrate ABC transporter membrane protein 2, CUT1 family [Rathayibacter oskolensis]
MTSTLTPSVSAGPDAAAPASAERARRRRPFSWGRFLAWASLTVILLITLFPFYWMLRTALSTNSALFQDPGNLLPVEFSWGGFRRVLGLASPAEAAADGGSTGSINFWLYLRNSVIVATAITAGQVFFSSMAAYAFARLQWKGRDAVFFLFLTALMIPPIFVQLPNFILIRDLGLLNTLAGIILPFFFMTPFAVFFMRQFFLGISHEIEEAAMIDGAGRIRVFFRVILPMSSTPIATLSLLTYITAWGEYFWPLLVGRADDSRVLTVALGIFRSQTPQTGPDWAGLMAGTLVAALPVLLLFLVFGRRLVNNLGYSGIK